MKTFALIFLSLGLVVAKDPVALPSTASWWIHITSPSGDFSTKVFLGDKVERDATFEIFAFDVVGNLISRSIGMLRDGVGRERFLELPLTNEEAHISHLAIFRQESERHFYSEVRVIYTANETTPVNITPSDVGSRFRFFPGDWSKSADSFAIMNTSEIPTTLTLKQFDATGLEKFSVVINGEVPGYGKKLVVLNQLAQLMKLSDGDFFEIQSETKIAFLALSSSIANNTRFLWKSEATVVE